MELDRALQMHVSGADETASEAWLSGRRKRHRESASNAPQPEMPSSGSIPAPALTTSSSTELTHEVAVARCHRLVQWMMSQQLGGRHNAIAHDDAPSTALDFSLQLAVEQTRPTGAALKKLTKHAVRLASDKFLCQSVTRSVEAAPEVVAYRKHLMLCWDAVSLVGGVCEGDAPHARAHALRLVKCGLSGQRPQAVSSRSQMASSASTTNTSSATTATEALLSLLGDSDDES